MLAAPGVLENVQIILVEPQTPANVGAAARAMKTMGLSRLALVRPGPWREAGEAWYIAHGAQELLSASEEFATLDAAIAPLCLVAGTTNRRRRRLHATPERPDTAAARLVAAAQGGPVGVLFGSEDTGLTGDDLSRCPIVITIPSARERPSLNLSHAVQVMAYELFLAAAGPIGPPPPDLASAADLEALYGRILELMLAVGFHPREDDPAAFLPSLRRCFGRAGFESRDVRTMHRVLSLLNRFVQEHAARGKGPTTETAKARKSESAKGKGQRSTRRHGDTEGNERVRR